LQYRSRGATTDERFFECVRPEETGENSYEPGIEEPPVGFEPTTFALQDRKEA
jgi:hypothetical protein